LHGHKPWDVVSIRQSAVRQTRPHSDAAAVVTSAEEGGYVFGSVCLSVCLFVCLSVGLLANL